MGMNYNPTENDIKQWMNMTDTDSDGQISLPEFEELVIKSLEFAGVQIFE
jgi:Ca2+-binding EF-hand superfamily protein